MPIAIESFPIATDHDPAEDPPGSIDPLGTLTYAERLADILFPGFTARMYRPRLLTVATVAAEIARRVVELMGHREELRLEARLAFERLVVSAIVRQRNSDPAGYRDAARRLPGSALAQRGLTAGNEPLTRQNFLRGPAVNGPSGVVMRLARQTGLIDESDRIGRFGQELLLRWAEGEGIPGILDDIRDSEREGAKWIRDISRAVADCVTARKWPGSNQAIWGRLAAPLRLDRLRGNERQLILHRLRTNEIRARMLSLLEQNSVVDAYNAVAPQGRAVAERATLVTAVRRQLGSDPIDAVIASAIDAVDAYEQASSLMQQAFDAIGWGLKRMNGRTTPAALLGDPRLLKHFERTRTAMARAVSGLDLALESLRQRPATALVELLEPLEAIKEEARLSCESAAALLDVVMTRHERVQRAKRKGVWIERDGHWTLLPGFGFEGDTPPSYLGVCLHPLRVQNAYSFLGDLRRVRVRGEYGEAE